MIKRAILFVWAAWVAAAICAPASADMKAPPKLPPGMTPAMFHQIMTAGPSHPAGIPAGEAPFLGCIPTMGYHYVKPNDMPAGPIHGWYKGKLIFSEVMLSKAAFQRGQSWDEVLQPLPGHQINHVDIWYASHGHPGYTVPHYDIHAWYVPHDEHMHYCNNPSGERPAWLK